MNENSLYQSIVQNSFKSHLSLSRSSRKKLVFNNSNINVRVRRRPILLGKLNKKVIMNGSSMDVVQYFELLAVMEKIKKVALIQGVLEICYMIFLVVDHQEYAICTPDTCNLPLQIKEYSLVNFILRILTCLINISIFFITYIKHKFVKEKYTKTNLPILSKILFK
jgi:hypothetical protein